MVSGGTAFTLPGMARSARYEFGRRRDTYYQATHRPLNCLVFLLPLIALYELGSMWVRSVTLESPPERVIAFNWIVEFLGLFTAAPHYLPGVVLLCVLLVWQIGGGHPWRFRWSTAGGMFIESVLLVAPLYVLNLLIRYLYGSWALAGLFTPTEADKSLILLVTASIYEELIFRLLLIYLIKLLLVDVMDRDKSVSTLAAVLVSGVLFAAYHYAGTEQFLWRTFIFRSIAGVTLGTIYVMRGFGITVGTHAFYNVAVTFW